MTGISLLCCRSFFGHPCLLIPAFQGLGGTFTHWILVMPGTPPLSELFACLRLPVADRCVHAQAGRLACKPNPSFCPVPWILTQLRYRTITFRNPPVLGKQRANTVSLGLFIFYYKDIQKDSKSAKCPPCNNKQSSRV